MVGRYPTLEKMAETEQKRRVGLASFCCAPLTEHGIALLLGLIPLPDERIACSLWSLGDVRTFGFAREGSHCRVRFMNRNCSAARNLIIPELLLGIYTHSDVAAWDAADGRPRRPGCFTC